LRSNSVLTPEILSRDFNLVIRFYEENRNVDNSIIKYICINTLRTGDADLRFYIAAVQDG